LNVAIVVQKYGKYNLEMLQKVSVDVTKLYFYTLSFLLYVA